MLSVLWCPGLEVASSLPLITTRSINQFHLRNAQLLSPISSLTSRHRSPLHSCQCMHHTKPFSFLCYIFVRSRLFCDAMPLADLYSVHTMFLFGCSRLCRSAGRVLTYHVSTSYLLLSHLSCANCIWWHMYVYTLEL
jgi:hypothetical protein